MLWTPASHTLPFSWKNVWKVEAPSRIILFIWTAILGRVLMVDNLGRCGFTLVNWCCLMKKEWRDRELPHPLCVHQESLLHGSQLFGVSWTIPSNSLELLHCWKSQGRRHSKEAI
jgi:hypothetical protein